MKHSHDTDRRALRGLLTALALFAGVGAAAAAQLPVADIIIHNARVTTQNPGQPAATAIAIRNGRIQAVGSDREILPYRGERSQVFDAGRRRVIPGLNDSHLHAVRGARFFNLELRWEGVPSLADGLAMIREQAARTPEGQWVRVIGGWSPAQFAEKRFPTIEELNEAAPDTPVFVLYLYSRGFLNRAGLEALGIDADTPAPPGSRYEIGPDGKPTGILFADPSPVILYRTIAQLPQLSPEEQANSARHFYRELNRFGLTSAIDAGGGGHRFPDDYAASRALAEAGTLPLRISYYLFPQHPGRELEDFQDWLATVAPQGNDHGGLAHGYETEGGGEFLTWSAGDYENFMAPRPVQGEHMEPELRAVAELLVRNRWPFRIHATYDESVSRILDVLEALNADVPFDGLRWAIDHGETLSRRNIARIKALGGGVAIQDRLAFAGEDFLARYGAERAAEAPPLRDLLDAGIPVGAGSDATRVSSYNPWTALQWLVTGRTVGGRPLRDQRNRLSREEALRLYTLGSAWFSAEESLKGRIAPGQFADLAVLDADYFTVQEHQISRIESLLTLVGGRIVYAAGPYTTALPPLPAALPAWSPVNHFSGHWRSRDRTD